MSKLLVTFAFAIACLTAVVAVVQSEKISPKLQKSLATKTLVNIFIVLRESTVPVLEEVVKSTSGQSRGARATAVYNALKAHTTKSQAPVLAKLNTNTTPKCSGGGGLVPCVGKLQSFWISNQIYVEGADLALVNSMAQMEQVAEIREEEIMEFEVPVDGGHVDRLDDPSIQVEWGISKIGANTAWQNFGARGNGAIVGVIDTGAKYTHVAISGGYRNDGRSWFDPYRYSQNPADQFGHGTHVTGTIVGSETSGIGVAPEAKYIACKADDEFGGAPESLLLNCAQFMTCPHDPNGQNHDCTKAPHVVSNSWGGQDGGTWFNNAISAWHAVGIIPVFALGNNGGLCRTCSYPGSHPGVIGVGATMSTDDIASFSSRGPNLNGVLKPEVTAPGYDVTSASHLSDTGLRALSGTSMACPHVAGVVALLKGVAPNLTFEEVRTILQNSAESNLPTNVDVCAGLPNNRFPNHMFGYGRINAHEAVRLALESLHS